MAVGSRTELMEKRLFPSKGNFWPVLLVAGILVISTAAGFKSSCDSVNGDGEWNRRNVSSELKSWIESIQKVS